MPVADKQCIWRF